MSDEAADTEFELWAKADRRQKSYTVEVLHWFHYRPRAIRASWTREEVLTWELLRALEVLPQRMFLLPLLTKIAACNSLALATTQPLFKLDRVRITPYPSLGLVGGKRNCKSDVGLGADGVPTVWIEAKTASFKAADLEQQLKQQESAMAALLPRQDTTLVTLLPHHRALASFPNISWDDVHSALVSCGHSIAQSIADPDLSHGYRLIARELAERIESHPNRAKGWV